MNFIFAVKKILFSGALVFIPLVVTAGENSDNTLKFNFSASQNWVPYYSQDPKNPGILSELVPQILAKANITGNAVTLPPKRTVAALENGELDFDIVSPAWFLGQDVGAQFVLSRPIMEVREYYVSLPGKSFVEPTPETPMGTVAGYYYHDSYKYKRVDLRSEKELVIALNKQRFDYALIGDLPAKYWAKKLKTPIKLGPLHSKGMLHIRLNRRKQHLLPKLNQAIEELEKQGVLQALIEKYTQPIMSETP